MTMNLSARRALAAVVLPAALPASAMLALFTGACGSSEPPVNNGTATTATATDSATTQPTSTGTTEPPPEPMPTTTATVAPPPNPLEGLAEDWEKKAALYLDGKAADWMVNAPAISNNKTCNTCHTITPFLMADFPAEYTPNAASIRSALAVRVTTPGKSFYGEPGSTKEKESFATEAVLNAMSLKGGGDKGQYDAAVQRMWSQQNTQGYWPWLEFGLEPFETRNDWGAGLAAWVALDNTPSEHAAKKTKLSDYLKRRFPMMVFHDKIMVLWLSEKMPELLAQADKDALANELTQKQLPNGGFSLGTYGIGARAALIAGDADGYATGYAALALCEGTKGNAAATSSVRKALEWLAKNQAADGSWVGRSTNKNKPRNNQFMTEAATAYAAMAIKRCAPGR
jgi:Prenyltransferase and squalene oxidase repeat